MINWTTFKPYFHPDGDTPSPPMTILTSGNDRIFLPKLLLFRQISNLPRSKNITTSHQIFVAISLPAVYNNGSFSIKILERAL